MKEKGLLYFLEDSCLEEYERSVIVIAQRRLVRYLFNCELASLSEIIENLNISINSLAAIFVDLNHKGLIDRNEKGIWLTKSGRKWAIVNRREIFMKPTKIRYAEPLEVGRSMQEMVNVEGLLPKKYFL